MPPPTCRSWFLTVLECSNQSYLNAFFNEVVRNYYVTVLLLRFPQSQFIRSCNNVYSPHSWVSASSTKAYSMSLKLLDPFRFYWIILSDHIAYRSSLPSANFSNAFGSLFLLCTLFIINTFCIEATAEIHWRVYLVRFNVQEEVCSDRLLIPGNISTRRHSPKILLVQSNLVRINHRNKTTNTNRFPLKEYAWAQPATLQISE